MHIKYRSLSKLRNLEQMAAALKQSQSYVGRLGTLWDNLEPMVSLLLSVSVFACLRQSIIACNCLGFWLTVCCRDPPSHLVAVSVARSSNKHTGIRVHIVKEWQNDCQSRFDHDQHAHIEALSLQCTATGIFAMHGDRMLIKDAICCRLWSLLITILSYHFWSLQFTRCN